MLNFHSSTYFVTSNFYFSTLLNQFFTECPANCASKVAGQEGRDAFGKYPM